jgi:hypothetical protein
MSIPFEHLHSIHSQTKRTSNRPPLFVAMNLRILEFTTNPHNRVQQKSYFLDMEDYNGHLVEIPVDEPKALDMILYLHGNGISGHRSIRAGIAVTIFEFGW